jgi:chromosome segregation ATPase
MAETAQNPRAVIGGNAPPDPVKSALAPFDDYLAEAENWLDGESVENAEQMAAVDALAKQIKEARKAINAARDAAAKPLHDAHKAEVARWKPAQDDLDRIVKGLAAAVDPYKKRIAAEKAEAKRKAFKEAEAKRIAAEAAAAAAEQSSNIDALRQAADAKQAAIDARKAASATAKDKVTGLRTVHRFEIEDMRQVLNWIAANDRPALVRFVEDYVTRNHKRAEIDGVQHWTEKEAF